MQSKLIIKQLNTNSVYDLREFMNLGSSADCQIQLSGAQVQERHARLEKKNGHLYIKDLRSESGTFLNEAEVIEAKVRVGDVIRIADNELALIELKSKTNFPISSRNSEWQTQLEQLEQAARTDFPILLLGPSGTGKDILAQTLHQFSGRRLGPFMSVNCSALTETLVESELFGHIKGSFTGAIADRKGAFEAARGGTLFLDEIGDLPYGLQAKLLRALENNEIRPVGSDKILQTDVRIIAATHQNLMSKVQEGSFRSDLLYRLNVVTTQVPSLRNRMEDFDDLFYSFAKTYRVRFSFNAIQKLKKHHWNGNIRELKNLVARASALMPHKQIEEKDIEKLVDPTATLSPLLSSGGSDSSTTLPVIKEIEKQMIIKRLIANRGNQRRTAQDLGMPKSTLHDRMKTYKIDIAEMKKT